MDMVFSELLGFDDEAAVETALEQTDFAGSNSSFSHNSILHHSYVPFGLLLLLEKKVKAVFVFFPQWLPPPNTNKDILHMLAKTLLSSP